MSWRNALAALAVMTVAAGCGGTDASAIEGSWLLDELVIDSETYAFAAEYSPRATDAASAWVRFGTDGTVEGEGPCNGFGGSFDFDGRTLVFDDVTAQLVGCPSVAAGESAMFATFWGGLVEVSFDGPHAEAMEWTHQDTKLVFERSAEELARFGN